MNKCHFCNKPHLSTGVYKVYHLVHFLAIEPLTAKDIAKELNMSLNVVENYLLFLVNVDLLRRRKEKYTYLYVCNE